MRCAESFVVMIMGKNVAVVCLNIWLIMWQYFQVRDYIHVVDLADGHIAALQKLFDPSTGEYLLFLMIVTSLFKLSGANYSSSLRVHYHKALLPFFLEDCLPWNIFFNSAIGFLFFQWQSCTFLYRFSSSCFLWHGWTWQCHQYPRQIVLCEKHQHQLLIMVWSYYSAMLFLFN